MELSEHERTDLKLSYSAIELCLGRLQVQANTSTGDTLIRELADEIARQHQRQQGTSSFSQKSRTFLLNAEEMRCLRNCLPSVSVLQASSRSEDEALVPWIRSLSLSISDAYRRLEAPHQQQEAERRARLIAEYDTSKR